MSKKGVIIKRFLFLLLWYCSFLDASVIINSTQKKYDNFFIQHYNSQEQLTIEEVTQREFIKEIPNRFSFGYTTDEQWFKIEILNASHYNKFILYFSEVLFDKFDLYEYKDDQWQRIENGTFVPIKKRNIQTIHPAFVLELYTNENKTYYLHGKSQLSNLGEFSIYEYETFLTRIDIREKLYLVYFGILSILILLNLFLFYRFKEDIYLYYVGYTLFFALFVLSYSGFILYFGFEQWYYELYFAPALFLLFLLLFSNRFLNIATLMPKTYNVLKVFVVLFAILAILIIVDMQTWYPMMNVLATFVFILLLYAAISTMQLGNKKSIYYLIAISVYMFTILFMSSLGNGWVSYNYFNRYAYLFGSCFEIVFFALMLVNRFYTEQHQRLAIQQELLEVKNKNEAYLQLEVENRTQEIQEMNGVLYGIIQDKELLLKELYHRVKNNFQMVISLLWIELNQINSEEKKERLENIVNRIKTMSFMHDYLYNSSTLSNIKSDNYILSIVDDVKDIYSNAHISINTSLFNSDISISDAMNVGMIINEILNNSIKHHHNKDDCVINLYFKKYDNKYLLSIQDNGPGFDATLNHEGLGMGMIQQFVNKLNEAEFIFINNHGTRFELAFKSQSK